MEGINVIVGTRYFDNKQLAIANATASIRSSLGGDNYVQDVHIYGGGDEQIGIEFELIVKDVGVVESYLNTIPEVESFERFGFTEVEA